MTNLSKSIQVQACKSVAGKDTRKLADSNPNFMWLLRDVILTPTDEDKKPCHIKDYLSQKVPRVDVALIMLIEKIYFEHILVLWNFQSCFRWKFFYYLIVVASNGHCIACLVLHLIPIC